MLTFSELSCEQKEKLQNILNGPENKTTLKIKKLYKQICDNQRNTRYYPCYDTEPCNSPNCGGYNPDMYGFWKHQVERGGKIYPVCYSANNPILWKQITELLKN